MKALMILLGAWPSLALSTPPSWIANYGWVTPKATFEGRLLKVLNDGIVVTVQDVWSFGEPSADRRTLMYWDLEFGMTDTLDLLPLIQGQYSRLAMSPDGELLAVMFVDSVNVSILRLDTGEVVSSFLDDQAKPDRQRHMEFSDGGRMLALNNKTRGVNYWRVSDGALAEVRHNTSISSSVAVSPDWRTFSYTNGVEMWVANLTYIRTGEGFLYLSVVVDAWSRRVVGWAMATHLRTQLVLDALDMALTQRRPGVVIHHSDHDSQYAAHGSTGPVTAERET